MFHFYTRLKTSENLWFYYFFRELKKWNNDVKSAEEQIFLIFHNIEGMSEFKT